MDEQLTSKEALERLLSKKRAMDSAGQTERAKWGRALDKAEAEDHLNKWAFGVAARLANMDPAKCAHNFRALQHYVTELGLDAQTDIEDAVAVEASRQAGAEKKKRGRPAKAKAESNVVELKAAKPKKEKAAANGAHSSNGGAVAELASSGTEKALESFTDLLGKLKDVDAIRKALDKFVSTWPVLEDKAHEAAEVRVAALSSAAPAKRGRPPKQPAIH